MLTVQITNLEAAALISLLIEAARISEYRGNETHHDLYMRIAQQIGETIASTRAELIEADLP